jgi:predicted ATPase
MLLVLDNFEQLISAATLLKELIAASPSLRLLITSRVALRLSIEREYAVLPLSIPPKDTALSAAASNEYAAIRLFAARARAAKKGFVLTDENVAAIAGICRRLDGLPLAIELASARVRLLSVDSILARLENSLQLLTGGANDLPERQRTMRGTIEWSYDLLDKDERSLFRRLAVFAGGFTVEAAEEIVERKKVRTTDAEDSIEITSSSEPSHLQIVPSVLDLLTSLLDNNLLVSREQEDGGMRLQMLEVVRDFAFEMLSETDEFKESQQLHARFFLALAEEAEPLLLGETGVEWLAKLESDHDNFRSALSWSLANDHEIAARLAAALGFFWFGHTHFSEGLGWCNAALKVTESGVSDARVKILLQISIFLRHRGEFEAARKVTEKCLSESRELNNITMIQKAVHGLGCIAVVQKDFTAAEKFYHEALELSRKGNDERRIAYTLGSLGDLEMCKGNHSAARVFLEECRTLAEKLGDRPVQTTIYYNLGAIDYFEGLYQEAALKFARSLQICEEMGFKSMMSCALDGFAALAAVGGNFDRSAQLAGAVDSLR